LHDGYAETNVAAIAAESGVSRASVFRYWGSKSEIVWAEFNHHLRRLESALEDVSDDVPTMVAVRTVIEANLERSVNESAQWLERFEVIDSDPDLRMEKAWRWGQWGDVVAVHIARRHDLEPDGPLPQSIAAAVQACFVSILRLWRGSGHPPEHLRARMDRVLTPLCDSMQAWLGPPLVFETGSL
jgi:AcrR family transcriptional regulator